MRFYRITEFKFLTGQKDTDGTTIVKEYPFAYTGAEGEIPYYAILNEENQTLYEKIPGAHVRAWSIFICSDGWRSTVITTSTRW